MPGGGGRSTTVSKQELSPEERQLLGFAMPMVKQYASTPMQLFPGSTIAGPTNLQNQGRADLVTAATGPVQDLSNRSIATSRDFMSGGRAGLVGGMDLLGAGRSGADAVRALIGQYKSGQGSRGFLESGTLLNPASNPVLGSQIRGALMPVEEALTERILPGIRSDFVGRNMFGSDRQGIVERGAVRDFTREAGRIASDLQMNNFNQGLGAMLSSLNASTGAATSAAGQGLGAGQGGTNAFINAALKSMIQNPQLAQLAFLPGMTQEGVGAIQQRENQARLTEEADRFTTQQMLPLLQAKNIANLAFGMGGGSATTTGQQNPGFDPIGTGVGVLGLAGLMGMGPMAALFASDRRLKRKIRKIGEIDGTNIYSFTYVGGDKRFVGVMADEVPHAVAGQILGFDVVDYRRLTA